MVATKKTTVSVTRTAVTKAPVAKKTAVTKAPVAKKTAVTKAPVAKKTAVANSFNLRWLLVFAVIALIAVVAWSGCTSMPAPATKAPVVVEATKAPVVVVEATKLFNQVRGEGNLPTGTGYTSYLIEVPAHGFTTIFGSPQEIVGIVDFGEYNAGLRQSDVLYMVNPSDQTVSVEVKGWAGSNALAAFTSAPKTTNRDEIVAFAFTQMFDNLNSMTAIGNCGVYSDGLGCLTIGYGIVDVTSKEVLFVYDPVGGLKGKLVPNHEELMARLPHPVSAPKATPKP